MTAPERILVGFRGVATHQMDTADRQYILNTREALAASPEVQALVMAERERCARIFDELAVDQMALTALYRSGSNPWFGHIQAAKTYTQCAAAIRAGTEGGE